MRALLAVVVLIAALVSQITQAQLTFSAGFALSRYDGTEGSDLSVRLSASVLTSIPINFGGSIEVDVTAEDIPGGAIFGTDYLVNLQNPLSRIFTVSFQPLQANSTENVIQLSDDIIFEGTETFGLRIVEARFTGQAADIFRADDTLNNAFAEVHIADDDFVEVNFTTSRPQEVTEGDGVSVTLQGEAFGIYANPIEIGVICAPVDVSGVPGAMPIVDFSFTPGTRIRFTDVGTARTLSSNILVVPIINDDIAEPCESLICTLQGGALDAVRGIEPNRVTIRICDDDPLVVRWATDFYAFGESEPATVELVTDSVFESATVRIQGFPRLIPFTLNGTRHPNRLPSLSVCGPRVPGLNFNASIEQAEFEQIIGGVVFGNAQVTQSGRTDVVSTFNDFIFTPTNKSALENFTIVDDDVLEFDEILFAEFDFGPEIINNWNAIKGEPSTAIILIRDDDSVEVNFNEDNYAVAESAGQVNVSLRIDGQYFVPVWAIVEIIDGTATDPEDYSSAVRYNVTFCQTAVTDTQIPTRSTVSSPIVIDITDDDIFEGVEYFQARIVETSDRFRVRIGQDTVNVTIIDSVTVKYDQKNYTVQEEAGSVTLALVLEGDGEASINTSVPVTVTVRTLDLLNSSYGAAATASVDYTPRGPFQITFPAGSTRQEYTVNIIDDFIPENSEFFNADIVSAGPAGVIIGEPRQPVIEILDTVDVVTVQYDRELYSVEEEAGSVTLALVLDRAVPFPVTVTVRTLDLLDSSVGDAATVNDDYTPRGPFNITFPAGSTRQEYTVNIMDDSLPENSEFFNADVYLARPEDASFVAIGNPKQPLIEIQDIDVAVAISLDRTAYSIFENEQVVTVTLTLNDTYREDIVVNVTVGELLGIPDLERAQAGVDFSIDGFPRQVTIPAGQTSAQFNVSVIDELLVERDEQFQVSFTYSGGQPGVVVRPGFDEERITIGNDDALMVMFERDSYSVREDAGSLMYRVIATGNASFDYEVVITGADGSATCGLDYHEPVDDSSGTDPTVMSCSYSLTITIPAGSSAGDGVVAIISDTIYEGTENFFLNLSVAQTFPDDGINEGSPLRVTVEIEDDDELRVFFAPANYSVPEGENQVLVLRTDKEFAVPFTINVTLEDGTAVAPGDYENRSYQVVFNVTTQTGTLVVHTNADNITENDEYFTAVLSVPAGLPRVFEGTPSEATVTILDQTTAEVYFDPATYNVTEGQPADLILRLTSDVDPSVTIIVRVQTRDGSATDGADYTGGLYIATFSGSSTTSVRVPTLSDIVLEGLETFTGVIQVPPETTTNYRVTAGSPDTAMVNIMDATIAGVYFDPDVYMVNEGGTVTLILRTNVTVNKRFSVLVNTRDDSANSPADYLGGERRAIFEIGSSMATVEYSTVNDGTREGIESFIAALTVPPEMQAMGIVPGVPDSATVNIIDSEVLVCMLVRTMHEVGEDMGPLVAMVMCSVPSDEPFTLIVQTSDGTAVDGQDYSGGNYSVIFPAGSTKANFSISITDDDIFENDETFFLTLVIPQPAQDIGVMRGDPFMATVTIIDDDELRVFFAPANYSVPEGENQVLVLRTDNVFAVPFTIDVTLRDGTAVAPGDYEDRSYQVVFNVTTQTGTLVVNTQTDNIIENDEDFTAVLSVPAGLTRVFEGTPSEATVTILDQTTAEVYFDPAKYNVTEGQPADLILRLTSDVDPSVTITVMVQTMDGSATDGLDYPGGLYTATFSGSSTTSVPCPTLSDNVLEGLEYFTGVIQVPPDTTTNYRVTAGSPDTAMVCIIDATIAGVYFDPDVYPVNEGDNVTLILRTNVTVNKRFSVLVNTRDDSANSPADYQGGERRAIFEIGSSVATVEYSTVNDGTREGIESFIAELTVPPEMQAMGIVPGVPDSATVNIIDSEVLVCMLVRTMHEVREDMGPLVAMVMCSVPSDEPFTLIVQTSDGTAVDGQDYSGGNYSVIFPAGSTKANFSISITDDDIFENDETFFLTLVIPQPAQDIGVMRGDPFMATVTIIDDDELRVFFDPANYSVPEGENQVLVLRTDNVFAVPFTIDVTLRDGTAVAPGDYEDRSYQVVFNVATQTGTLVVNTETDNIIENDEYFTAVLSVPAGLPRVFEGTPSEATVTILDQTTAEVYFDPAKYNVTEGQPADLILRLTSDVDPSVTIIVLVQTRDGSATDGADYTGGLYTATFSGSNTTSVRVPTLSDNVLEGLECFTGVIQVPPDTTTNYRVTVGLPDTAMVCIIDATIAGVYFDPDVYPVNEGDNVTLILRTNVTVNKRFSVLVTTYDDSANSPEDYQGGERRAIFEIGSSMATVVYSTVNDGIREGIESFIANLTVPPEMQAMGIVPGMPDRATVNIIDDEVLVCMLVRTMHEVSEDMGPLVAMVMCSIPADEPFTLIVRTSNGTAGDGEDYTGGDYSVFFSAGSTKESFSIPITDDDIFELDETFFLTLVIPQPAQDIGVMRGVPFNATVTIINDEPTVTIDIERRVIDVIENQEVVEVCLVKSGPSSLPVMALVNADEFTDNVGSPVTIDATSDVDFEPDVPEIILAPSETRNCTNVTIIDDKIVERMEPFEVIITFPSGQPALQIGEIVPNATQINGTINIIDDDVITVEFEQAMYMVDESEGMVDVTVIASGRTSFEYTFTVTPMDRTATNNFDYLYSTTTYTFGPTDETEPIPSLVISIPIINDGDNELNETFKLTLEVSADGEAANVTEGPISMTVVLIKDNDDVTVTFSPQNYTVTEGDPAPLMIILDKPAAKDITVTVTTMDITATDTDDYIGGPFDVSIPAGSVKVTLNVSTLQDNIVELPEYFKATLSLPGAPEGCVVGTPDMSYITIIDNTPMIPVWFNPANYSVKEGVDGNAVIFLEAGDHNFDFTVIVNSQDGTAFNGSDYTGGPFEVTFPAGVNMVSFNVPILDDAIAECAKLFNLDLDIPVAAAGMGVIRGSPDTATVHIMDDDVEELRLSIENADYMVKENVVSFVAAVVASRAADFEYTVTVETSNNTAVGGDDFVSQQYQLTFPAGQTRAEFTVATTDDNVIEAMESFQLLLSIPQDLISKGVQVGPNSAATVTIMDNDVQVKFSQSSVATTEEEGRVLVTVEAMGDLSSDFSIIVMAINGTAVEPFDFTGNMWPVDFLANQASASFEISIVQDNLPETREEFSLKIVIESPYDERVTVGEPSELTVVITDRKNDTVRGDPLFSIPLPSKYTDHTELQSIQLCFEIHGQARKHYNLISDACTSVSAQYKQGENDPGLNVISNIGVKAQGSNGSCHEIEVDLVGCSAQLDGTSLITSVTVNGISIMIRRQRVRVSVPNCASSTRLTMWMMCMNRNNEDMLELVVARGDGLEPTAHGLIGQFWNIPVTITSYTGPYGDGTAVASDRIYSVTVAYPGAPERTFIADYGKKDWLDGRPCLYAGNHNGGPIGEVKGSGSVIEGKYSDYEVADLFATNYTFSKFEADC